MRDKCRVCGAPATRKLGNVSFCETHYDRAVHQRASKQHADLVSAAMLVAFVLVVAAVDRWLHPEFTPLSLVVAGIALAMVPAGVWLAFFHRRDRREPEPMSKVLRVFVLGALLAGAIGIPLVERGFDVSSWLYRSPATFLVGAVLVVGFTQEFLKYGAVRFWVYDSPDFDELCDGVVYASAAGLGYATALNVAFVLGSGGVDLGLGAVHMVLTALAHAGFAGISGYFLAAEKLQHKPWWWTTAGVSLAAALNGVFTFTRGMLTRGGLSEAGGAANPWLGLALAVGLIVAVTFALSSAMRREIASASASGDAG